MPFLRRSPLPPQNFVSLLLLLLVGPAISHGPHVITVRSPNLSPASIAWDPSSQHFAVGSSHRASIHSVSDAGVIQTLVSDHHLPPNASVLAVAVDPLRRRLLAVIHPLSPFAALAAYDLSLPALHPRLFVSSLSDPTSTGPLLASALAVDAHGNAFVARSGSNLIWKVDGSGQSSVFSNSSAFYTDGGAGLGGIAYVSTGYFLAVQSDAGKMYKIDGDDGSARVVLLQKDLAGAAGIAIRADGTAVVVSCRRAWFVKSDNGWAEAVVFDEIALGAGKCAKGVAMREGRRAYVLYGEREEGILGKEFGIEEVASEREREGENVWMLVLLGFGLAYFLYWRFQMGRLVKELNRKRE